MHKRMVVIYRTNIIALKSAEMSYFFNKNLSCFHMIIFTVYLVLQYLSIPFYASTLMTRFNSKELLNQMDIFTIFHWIKNEKLVNTNPLAIILSKH